MISDNKITGIFCLADEFCSFFNNQLQKSLLQQQSNIKKRNRTSTLRQAEVITILIIFHLKGYRCLKHFYLGYVCKHMHHLFPHLVSYNRFVELQQSVMLPLGIFVKEVLLGTCTGITFVGSTPLRVCRSQRAHGHKVFQGIAATGHSSMGWFFGFKLHLICNDKGELLNFVFTPANTDDCEPLSYEDFMRSVKGKLVGDKGGTFHESCLSDCLLMASS